MTGFIGTWCWSLHARSSSFRRGVSIGLLVSYGDFDFATSRGLSLTIGLVVVEITATVVLRRGVRVRRTR